MPSLYVIATPIGNLHEMTPRAIAALQKCEYAFCEDTRTTARLLQLLGVPAPKLVAHHRFNETASLAGALKLVAAHDCALLSDAGYPTISDPGHLLVRAVRERLPQVRVETVNGANAALCALAASGFCADDFYFAGFVDRNKLEAALLRLAQINSVIVMYEAVHRIQKTLAAIAKAMPGRPVCVARELTKMNETFYFGDPQQIAPSLTLKGEFVVLVDNRSEKPQRTVTASPEQLQAVKELVSLGVRAKDACKFAAKHFCGDASAIYSALMDKE